jgi:sugar-specific transcriptional regulator TrmB
MLNRRQHAIHLLDEAIETLERLGLTSLEAKVYVALAQTGKSTVKIISKISDTDRANTYRTINKLQKRGLITKTINTPNRYEAIPIQEGITALLKDKIQENQEIKEKAKSLLQKIKTTEANNYKEEEHYLSLVPTEKAFTRFATNNLKNIQRNLDIIAPMNLFMRGCSNLLESYRKALERGVKMRVVTEKPENEKKFLQCLQPLIANPNFKLRYTLNPSGDGIGIVDEKDCAVFLNLDTGFPVVVTNEPKFLKVLEEYFQKIWKKALEYEPE